MTSKEFGWPKLITFLDNEANIIEEFPIQMTSFQVDHFILIIEGPSINYVKGNPV